MVKTRSSGFILCEAGFPDGCFHPVDEVHIRQGDLMARKPTADDFKEHERTYDGFIRFGKWSVVALAIMMVALYFLINP